MTHGKAYSAGLRLVPPAAAGVLASLLLACVSGCSPQVASIAPLEMASLEMAALPRTAESAAAPGAAETSETPDKEEHAARCAQLLKAPPGVEEIRIGRTGAIESRELHLVQSEPHPQWVVYRHKKSAPDGWRPQPRIAALHFVPPLRGILPNDEPRYLAYAVTIADQLADGERMMSVVENFGSRTGTFQWRNRTYSYVLVKKLPCFSGPQ